MPTQKRALLVATAVCLLVAAASLAAAAQAVTGNRYTLPIHQSWFPGYLSADSNGKIWAGSTYSSSGYPALLAVDPAASQLTVWTHQNTDVFLPSGPATAVDSLNRVWFRGGLANGAALVSRLDPSSGQVIGWPATPYDFAPTPQGRLWMSVSPNLGLLDPATNVLTTWPQTYLLRPPVASDPQGRGWFALGDSQCASAGHSLAVLDPVANTVTTWALPTPSAPQFQQTTPQVAGPRAITVDGSGKVWVAVWYQYNYTCSTARVGSAVVVLDPATNVMKLWPCPSGCDQFTTISVDPEGKAWLTDAGNGTGYDAKMDRLDLNSNPVSFVEYDAGTLMGCANLLWPFGTVADLQGNGWLSLSGYNSCAPDKISQLPP